MKALVPVLVLLGLAGLGSACSTVWNGGSLRERSGVEFVVNGLAGAVALHLYLNLLALLEIKWSALVVGVPLAFGVVFLLLQLSKWRGYLSRARQIRWGEVGAGLVVVVVAALAVRLSIMSSDFIYHWGAKGQRFYLAQTIDYEYLARPWNTAINPNYPTLLPEVYAATAVLVGGFWMPAAMSWTAIWLALILLAARGALGSRGGSQVEQLTLIALATTLGTLIVGLRLAGGADLLIALALIVALPLASEGYATRGDWVTAASAAFAAASKLEGVILGALLVAVRLGWHAARGSLGWRAALRTALLPSVVVAHWGLQNARLGLGSGHTFSFGELDVGRARTVAAALWQALGSERTYGLCFLVLLLPLLLWGRNTRFAAVIILVQLSVYAAFYFGVRDPARYALTSFPRLVVHLLPAVITGTGLLIAGKRYAKLP